MCFNEIPLHNYCVRNSVVQFSKTDVPRQVPLSATFSLYSIFFTLSRAFLNFFKFFRSFLKLLCFSYPENAALFFGGSISIAFMLHFVKGFFKIFCIFLKNILTLQAFLKKI